jgi:glycosyltransferase involved in cell wall biosynthesis
MPGSILFVHQGYELYGSDRTLIQSVLAATMRWPGAEVTVLLPSEGVLKAALLHIVADVRVVDLAILRKSNLKSIRLRDVGRLLSKLQDARKMMRSYDITYINTVMVMDYILAACFVRKPRIIHVHEIPTGAANLFFTSLLTLSRAFILFNSHATQHSFKLPFWQRKAVVWNGVAAPKEMLPKTAHAKLNLLLIGRFNSWKGQAILLRALALLPPESRSQLNARLVGSVFGGQNHFKDELTRIIAQEGLGAVVEMCPFTPDPVAHYEWADIVLVPSTKPEPFGLVAIEAMAAGCSVIAADHGGLSEIVVNGVTGTLVKPASVESLAGAIAAYLVNPDRARIEGNAGQERFTKEFEERHYMLKVTDIVERLCIEASA